MLTEAAFFWLKYRKIVIFWNIINILNTCFLSEYIFKCISVMAKLYFQQHLLQSSASHGPSEIILICCLKKHFLLLYISKTAVMLNIVVETVLHFPKLFWEIKS